MMNLVIVNNLKKLKKHEKNAINPKERGTFSLEEKTFQEVTPLFAAIMCGHHTVVELLVKYQSFDFVKEVGEDSPDIYSLKLAPEISEEQLNQKIEELQLICAATYSWEIKKSSYRRT